MPRKPSCLCGQCRVCKSRARTHRNYLNARNRLLIARAIKFCKDNFGPDCEYRSCLDERYWYRA